MILIIHNPYKYGPVTLLAAIFKVGAKASFVFYSMIGYLNSTNRIYEYGSGSPAFEKSGDFFVFLIPSMRFQTQPNSAFQISIAGVSLTPKGYASLDFDRTVTLPNPMLNWMFKF